MSSNSTRFFRPIRLVSLILALVMVMQIGAPLAAAAGSGGGEGSEPAETVTVPILTSERPSQVIVRYKAGPPKLGMMAQSVEEEPDLELVDVDSSQDIAAVLDELRADPNVAYAEPNYELYAQVDPTPPNDALFNQQWALDGQQIDAAWGWDRAKQTLESNQQDPVAVTVAVIDTGVDASHEDLQARMADKSSAYNAISDESGDYSVAADDSSNSHGTHVAGIIAAATDNGIGIAGVAGTLPVSIMPVKALDHGGVGSMYDVAMGIRWAADHGARVINLSLGARLPDFPSTLAEAVVYAQDKGALVVAAAGNDASPNSSSIDGFYPACLPGVVPVAASGEDHAIASFSNLSSYVAPGVGILSTIRGEEKYGLLSGTSSAAPMASGIAAAVFSVYPATTGSEVADIMYRGRVGYEPQYDWLGRLSGYNHYVLSLYGALGKTAQLWDYLEIIAPENRAYVKGTVEVTARATNPSNVDHVTFTLYDAEDRDDPGTVLGTVGSSLAGVYTVTWDTTGVDDGEFWIEAVSFDGGGIEIESDSVDVTVVNEDAIGLTLTVKKPPRVPGGDAEPAVGAPVAISHVVRDEWGGVTLERVWNGETGEAGQVAVPNDLVTDGNDFFIATYGSDPGFLYFRTVRSPGEYVFDSTGTREVSITAVTADGTPIAGGVVEAEMLGSNLAGLEDPQAAIDVPNAGSSFPVGVADGSGDAHFHVTPGAYNFRLLDQERSIYLVRREVSVDSDVDTTFGAADDLATFTLAPAFGFDHVDVTLSDGDRSMEFKDPGDAAITVSPGQYELDVETTFHFDFYGGSTNFYLDLECPLDAAPGTENPVQFGTMHSLVLTPKGSLNPGGEVPEYQAGGFALFDYTLTDEFGNDVTGVSAYPGSFRGQLTIACPDGSYVYPYGQAPDAGTWMASGASVGWSVPGDQPEGTYTATLSLNTTKDPEGNEILGSVSAGPIEFKILPAGEPWQPPDPDLILTVLDRTGVPFSSPPDVTLVEQDGGEFSQCGWLDVLDEEQGTFGCYDLDTTEGSYGVLVTGESLNPDDADAEPELISFYAPLPSGPAPLSVTVSAEDDIKSWRRVDLQPHDEESDPLLVEEFQYSVGMLVDGAELDAIEGESDTGSFVFWVPWDYGITVRATSIARRAIAASEEIPDSYMMTERFTAPEQFPVDGVIELGGGGLVCLQLGGVDSGEGAAQADDYVVGGSAVFAEGDEVGPIVWGSYYVTPGTYKVQTMVTRVHFETEWIYWLESEVEAVAGTVGLGTPGQGLQAQIGLDKGTYSLGSVVKATNQIADDEGNTLVAVVAGDLSEFEDMAVQGDTEAQNHTLIAPFLVIRDSEGEEVYRYKDPGENPYILGDWYESQDGNERVRVEPLGTGTYVMGEWQVPGDTSGGTYTATIELGSGPDGTLASDPVGFTILAAPGAPRLSEFESPTNEAAVTVHGDRALPGANVTVSYSINGGDAVEAGTCVAGEDGSFSLEDVELPSEGDYSFTAVVSSGGLTSDPSNAALLEVDRTPPGPPTSLSGESTVADAVNLSWTSPDDEDLDHFRITRDGVDLAANVPLEQLQMTYSDKASLQGGTEYTYRVYAIDLAGNESEAATVKVTTALGEDNEAPSAPTGVKLTFSPGGLARLTWEASIDNVAVTGYRVYRFDGAPPDTGITGLAPKGEVDGSTLVFDDSGLAASVQYTYWVTAFDAKANESLPSEPATNTTPPMFISLFNAKMQKTKDLCLKPGSTANFTLVGEPQREVQAVVEYSTWYDESDAKQAEPIEASETVTFVETEDGQGVPTGIYTGQWVLPAGVSQVSLIRAEMDDGFAGEPLTRTFAGTPFVVAGDLDVEISGPDIIQLAGARLVLWNEQYRTGATKTLTTEMLEDDKSCLVSELKPVEGYTLEVWSADGRLLLRQEGIGVLPGIESSKTVTPTVPASVAVTVKDSKTGVLVKDIRVTAYTAQETGTGISNSNGQVMGAHGQLLIPFAPSGTDVTLNVEIPDAKRAQFHAAAPRLLEMAAGLNAVEILLPRVDSATIEGKITDQFGEPLSNAQVRANSKVDGREVNLATTTDESGEYLFEVPVEAPVNLSISHRLTQSWSTQLQDLTPDEIRTLDLQFDIRALITADVSVRLAGSTEAVPLSQVPVLADAMDIRIRNETTGEEFSYWGNLLPEVSVFGAQAGQQIKVTIDGSRSGLTSDTVTVTLDDRCRARAAFELVEMGKVKAEVSDGTGSTYLGLMRTAVLYGPTPSLSARQVTPFSFRSFESQPLPAGKYIAVFYWTAALMSNSTPARGFWVPDEAGVPDFYSADVEVKDGEIIDLGQVVIDLPGTEGGSAFEGEGNSFTANVSEAAPGSVVTLRLGYSFNASSGAWPQNLTLTAQIPAGCVYVADSATLTVLSGDPSRQPTVNDNAYIDISLGNDALQPGGVSGILTYQVKLPLAPEWSTVQAQAWAKYQFFKTMGGSQFLLETNEPFDTVQVKVPLVSIKAPAATRLNKVNLSGQAAPGSVVKVYDGSLYLGEVTTRSYGMWQMQDVELPDRGAPGRHYLTAEVETGTETIVSTPVKTVTGSVDPVISEIAMYQMLGDTRGHEVIFYPSRGISSFPFLVKPGLPIYFDVRFDDPERISDARVIVSKGGASWASPAEWDEELGVFTAVSSVMGDVYVEYKVDPKPYSRQEEPPAASILRSGMPDAWRDAAVSTWGEDDQWHLSAQEVSTFPTVQVLLGGSSGPEIDFTVSVEPLSDEAEQNFQPTEDDAAAIEAGGPPVYNFTASMDDFQASQSDPPRVRLEASFVVPMSEIEDPSAGGQSLKAAAEGHALVKVLGESPVEGGLGVSDLIDTVKSGFEYKEKMDKLGELLDKVTASCGSSSRGYYNAIADSLAERLLTNLCIKYGLQLGGIALSATGVGIIGGVAVWAVSGILTEIGDAKWDTAFKKLQNDVANDEDCKDEDEDPDDPNDPDEPDPNDPSPSSPPKPIATPTYLIDPSGYVYEAVEDNRLQGVTATILEKGEGGSFLPWDSAWADQFNPLTTDLEGRYAWDVPEGDWKVTYEKDGYQSAESESMHVPPPRTDVNVGLVSLGAPSVVEVTAAPGGDYVEVQFSKYMKESTLSAATLTVIALDEGEGGGDGGPLPGTVAAVDAVDDPANAGERLSKTARFTPDAALAVGADYIVTVNGAVQAYSGVPLGEDEETTVTVTEEPAIGEVTNLTATHRERGLLVTWTDPVIDEEGDVGLDHVNVYWRTAGGAYGDPLQVGPDVEERLVTGLTGGVTYDVKVTVVDTLGRESAGVTTTGTPTSPSQSEHEGGGGAPTPPPVQDQVKFIAVAGPSHLEGFDGAITLDVESGTFGAGDQITVTRLDSPAQSGTMVPVSPVYELNVEGHQPGKPVLVSISFDLEALGDIDPAQIGIYMQDPSDPSRWTYVGGVVDPATGTVNVWLPHFSRYAVFASETTFGDLAGHWAETQVKTLASRGIVSGAAPGIFEPERNVTRAELAKMLVSMLTLDTIRGLTMQSPAAPTFADVRPVDWFYSYVETAAALGLIKGDGGLFRPDDLVTREEMAAMAVRALGLEDKVMIVSGKEPVFEDSGKFDQWAKGYVNLAVFKGLMQGVTSLAFDPKGLSTRAQAAVVVLRVMERLGLVEKTEVVKGTLHLGEVEGTHLEMVSTEGGKTTTYVLLPDGGPDGSIAKQFDGLVGTELRVLAVRQDGASAYMRGPVLRVLEVWKPGCPLCPPE